MQEHVGQPLQSLGQDHLPIFSLRIHLFGEFWLEASETDVPAIEMPRLQSLLAYLLLHRTIPQSRAHLAFLLWPDSTEEQAQTNLRKALYLLRQTFPQIDSFLHIGRLSLSWKPGTAAASWTLDVQDFEQALARAEQADHLHNPTAMRQALAQAVDLYHGDLLPSCYDEWILPERDRLRQAFFTALERLIVLLEEEHDDEGAISAALRLLRHDPLHEETYRHLMRLYAVRGDRAAALRTFHTCATVLERELGTAPGEATREVYERLMQTDASTSKRGAMPSARGTAAPLVGRAREWAQLLSEWRSITGGSPRVVVLSGEAGIGKTRLAEELLAWVSRQGVTTASARCYEASGALAYAPVVAWLQADAVQDPLLSLPDVWLSEVARLLPDLLARRPDLPRPGPLTQPWQHQHLFEALARALLSVRQPLLLLLDDLHWCDAETLAWLHYLLHADPQARFLLVGTRRPEETGPDHPLTSLLLGLRREGLLTEMALSVLDAAETASLAERLIGHKLDAQLVEDLYRETEGNPLFLVEMMRAASWEREKAGGQAMSEQPAPAFTELPPTAQAVIATRLAQLSPPARELAGIAAVIGRAFPLAVLAQASGRDEDTLVRDVDELWQRRIVREQGSDAYDFSHDKLREGAYAALSRARRRLLHRRVAEALAAVYATSLDTVSGQIAVHYEQAGLPQQAIPYYQRAGAAAVLRYAHADALTSFQHALTLLEAAALAPAESGQHREVRASLYESLGDILHVLGQQEEARQAYKSAVEYCASQDRIEQTHLYGKIAETMEDPGRYEDMLSTYRVAEHILGPVSSEHGPEWWQEWVQVQLGQMVALFYQGRVSEMTAIIERVRPFVEQHATAAQRAHFFAYVALGDLRRNRFLGSEKTLSACQTALAASMESGIPGEIGIARLWLGAAHLFGSDLEGAQEQLQAALHLGEQIGDVTLQGRCLAFLAITLRRRGQVETVRRLSERALALVSAIQFPGNLPFFLASLSWVAWRQGDLAEAQKQAQVALEMGQPLHLFPFQWMALLPLVGVALAEARDADAITSVRLLLSPTQQRLPDALTTVLEAAVQAWDADQGEGARSQLQRAIALAMELGYL